MTDVSIYNFTITSLTGDLLDLSAYAGKVILIVNTASKCGFTGQYAGLEALYQDYKDQGFTVIAFPSNDFGKQEPGTDEQIAEFCETSFRISFPITTKVSVKGKDIHPIFEYLTKRSEKKGGIKWNFEKFLILPDGSVGKRYNSLKAPKKIAPDIEAALASSHHRQN